MKSFFLRQRMDECVGPQSAHATTLRSATGGLQDAPLPPLSLLLLLLLLRVGDSSSLF